MSSESAKKGSFYSELSGAPSSFLPAIEESEVVSRRTERYGYSGRTEHVIMPPKRGFHRPGNTPTFKLLSEVSEKLQVLIDESICGKNEEFMEENTEDSQKHLENSSVKSTKYSGSSSVDSGISIPLRLSDYNSEISSVGSVFLTPLPEDQIECVYKNQLDNQPSSFLPNICDVIEDSSPAIFVPSVIRGDNSEDLSHHSEDVSFYHRSRHIYPMGANAKLSHHKKTSNKLPHSVPRKPRAQVRLSRSKRSEKSSLLLKNGRQPKPVKSELECQAKSSNSCITVENLLHVSTEEHSNGNTSSFILTDSESELTRDVVTLDHMPSIHHGQCDASELEDKTKTDNKSISGEVSSDWCYTHLPDNNRTLHSSVCNVIHGLSDNFVTRFNCLNREPLANTAN